MILVQDNMNDEGILVSGIVEYNKEIERDARDKFNKLKEKKIIVNLEFDDNIWLVTNKYATTSINFNFDEILYKKELKNREMLSYQDFINSVKSYCILRINNYISKTIAVFVTGLKTFMTNTRYLNPNYIDNRYGNDKTPEKRATTLILIRDFLDFIEIPNIDIYRELILEDIEYSNNYLNKKHKHQSLNRRNLTDFQSIFLFDKLINEFWDKEATEEEKTYYYPIYLWWNITNILPIRVTEFLLTPFDCIKRNEKGEYTISIRRSNLKGNGLIKYKNKVSYDIEKDYKLYTYPISEKIVMDIQDYKEKTKSYNRNLLMSLESYLSKDKSNIKRYMPTFLPNDLNKLLLKFYIEILSKRKNIKIVDDDYLKDKVNDLANEPVLLDNEIKVLRAGDTRHFAMINMVLNDFNPMLVKDFAGHTNINTSYHYFGNISEVVKCISYNKYQELCEYDKENLVYENNNITANKILLSMNEDNNCTTEVDFGICLSTKFFNGDLNDCKEVGADCDVCKFFKRTIKETSEVRKEKLNKYEDNIKKEGELLAKLLKNSEDNVKEIGESVLKIQSNATRYMHIFNDGGYDNGK